MGTALLPILRNHIQLARDPSPDYLSAPECHVSIVAEEEEDSWIRRSSEEEEDKMRESLHGYSSILSHKISKLKRGSSSWLHRNPARHREEDCSHVQ